MSERSHDMVRSFLSKFSPRSERRLLVLCLNNQDNDQTIHGWNKNAVRYLVRELKKDIKLIDELVRAISQQNSKSSCVLLPKTPDKRLLVSHRRGLPQVIYCRLWRWPDLQSHHQIKAISSCQSQETISNIVKQEQSTKVCVNPYHYERSNPKPIDPILVPCPKIPPDLSTSYEDSDTTGETRARPGNIICAPLSSRSFRPSNQNAFRANMSPVSSYQNNQGDYCQEQNSQNPQCQQDSQHPQYLQNSQHSQHPQNPQHSQYPQDPQHPQYIQEPQHPQLQPHQQLQYQQFPSDHQQHQGYQQQISQHTQLQHQQHLQYQPTQQQYQQAQPYQPFPSNQQQHQEYLHQQQQPQTSHNFYKQNYVSPQRAQVQQQAQPIHFQDTTATQYLLSQETHYPQQLDYNKSLEVYDPTQGQHYQQAQLQIQPQHQLQPELQPQQQEQYQQSQPTSQHQRPYRFRQYRFAPMTRARQELLVQDPDPPNPGDEAMDEVRRIDIQEIPYAEGTYWCSVSYHEYDQRVGDKYNSNCRVFCVDGYTQSMASDRFSIEGASNANRNQSAEWVCRRIGKGVRFTYVDGEVYVESLCESSVFVSHPLLVQEYGDNIVEHVTKLTQGSSARVFSTQEFATLLADAVAKDFEAVYKLTSRCVVRVSFVKGWGRNYKRQSIYKTPCWIEVQLNGPLQWIDKVLRQMRPPTGCGSTS